MCLSIVLSLTACGGSSSSSPESTTNQNTILSGTAAAGAAIEGQVFVKGSQGVVASQDISANGRFSIDVSDLTAPYLLQARGTVAGRQYVLSSFAADTSQNTNITPLTELVLANSLQQEPSQVFDSGAFAQLDQAVLAQQEQELRQRLAPLLSAAGVSDNTSLLAGEFVADHSGLDLVLDLIDVESKAGSSVKVIVNRLDQSRIEDDIAQSGETEQIQAPQSLTEVEQAIDAIAQQLQNFASLYATSLPSKAQLTPLFSASFLNSDIGLEETLNELSSDSDLQALKIDQLLIKQIDLVANTAEVSYRLSLNDGSRAYIDWQLLRNQDGVWQFNGNQELVAFDVFTSCSYGVRVSNSDCSLLIQIEDLKADTVSGLDTLVKSARVRFVEQGQFNESIDMLYGDNLLDAADERMLERLSYSRSGDEFVINRRSLEISGSILNELNTGSEILVELYDRELGIDQENEKLQIATGANLIASYKRRVLAKPLAKMPIDKRFWVAPASLSQLRDLSQSEVNIDWQLPSLAFNGLASFTFTGSNGEQVSVDKDIRFDASKQAQSGRIRLDLSELNLPPQVEKVELQFTAANASDQLFDSNYQINLSGSAAWSKVELETILRHFDSDIGAAAFYLNPNGSGFITYEAKPQINFELSWSLDESNKLHLIQTDPTTGEQSYLELERLNSLPTLFLSSDAFLVSAKRSNNPITETDKAFVSTIAAQLRLSVFDNHVLTTLFGLSIFDFRLVSRLASDCSTSEWHMDYIGRKPLEVGGEFEYLLDPCFTEEPVVLSNVSIGFDIIDLLLQRIPGDDVISLTWIYPDNSYRIYGHAFSLFSETTILRNCVRSHYFDSSSCSDENRAYMFWGPSLSRAEEVLEELNNLAP